MKEFNLNFFLDCWSEKKNINLCEQCSGTANLLLATVNEKSLKD